MRGESQASDPDRHQRCVEAFVTGDDAAAETLHDLIRPAICNAVGTFLAPDHADRDDVIQESILAVFAYIRRRKGFVGKLENFAATVARNRCRDVLRARRRQPHLPIESLQEWASDDRKNALDHLTDAEMDAQVSHAVAQVGRDCRELLRTLYFAGESIEAVRRKLGLGTVQTVYYRRNVCLKKVLKILKKTCL